VNKINNIIFYLESTPVRNGGNQYNRMALGCTVYPFKFQLPVYRFKLSIVCPTVTGHWTDPAVLAV